MFSKPQSPSFFFTAQNRSDRATSSSNDPEKSSTDERSSSDESSYLSENEIQIIRAKRPSRFRCWAAVFGLVHLVLFVVYIATVLSLRSEVKQLRKFGPQLVDSPAKDVVEWELHEYVNNDNVHGPFSGPPREEVDQNWHSIINAENIVLEPEYMERLGRDEFGVAMPDGSGFLGTLNVYHELHCIKRLYQYTYPEVYPQGDTPAAQESNRQHKDHCLDFLRQFAMCHADVGVITFQWSPNTLVPVANSTHHQCANWNKLDAWTKSRTVNMMKPGWLIHPLKGPAYPHGEEWH